MKPCIISGSCLLARACVLQVARQSGGRGRARRACPMAIDANAPQPREQQLGAFTVPLKRPQCAHRSECRPQRAIEACAPSPAASVTRGGTPADACSLPRSIATFLNKARSRSLLLLVFLSLEQQRTHFVATLSCLSLSTELLSKKSPPWPSRAAARSRCDRGREYEALDCVRAWRWGLANAGRAVCCVCVGGSRASSRAPLALSLSL